MTTMEHDLGTSVVLLFFFCIFVDAIQNSRTINYLETCMLDIFLVPILFHFDERIIILPVLAQVA